MATDYWPSSDNFADVPDNVVDQIWSNLCSISTIQPPADSNTRRLELESQDKEEAEKSHQEVEKAKKRFTEILEFWDEEHDTSKDTSKGKRSKEPIFVKVRANIAQLHSWEDVFSLLQEAEDHYNNSSKLRKFFRRGTSKSEVAEPFVDLIPNGHYTSVICTGMKLILGACSAANISRNDIIALVESLPERVSSATEYAELYSSEAILQTATSQLYVKILTAMESIIAFWTKDRTFEFLKPLFLQRTYVPLQVELDDVRKASERVERTIQFCGQRRLAHVANELTSLRGAMYEIRTQLKQLFAQSYLKAKWFREALIQTQQLIVQPPGPRAHVTAKEILKCLETSTTAPFPSANDSSSHAPLQQVLQAGFSMLDEDQHRATWAISNPKVYEWFQSQRSRALVINGNCTLRRISPLSFFCALLVESLQSLGPIIVLHHFCGLHTTRDSPGNQELGSSAIIRMLVYQLTTQWNFGELECLSPDDAQAFKGSGPNITDDFLFSIFSKMVKALPRRQPIFIIIDGINYYETQEFCQKTKDLVKKLVKLLGAPASVKLLVTSTTRTLDVSKYFEKDEKLLVPADPAPRAVGAANQQLKQKFNFGRSSKE